ncbi:MAG TPA: DUF4266 domain-containing protein [Rhodocyclaceae bacterium]
MRRGLSCLAVMALPLLLTACSGMTPVQPWQKGNLARPEMSFDSDPLEAALDEHVYFSKEGASGGGRVGGGGCGCN